MQLKHLNTLKIILDAGSFQNAAKQLNYTQSTVTYQIQQLEQELSVKLFEKIGRKMILTQAGKDVLPYINTIIQSIDQIKNYGNNNLQMTGVLRIPIPESLLVYRMQTVLKKFREQAPNVRLCLESLNCYAVREQIVNGNADMGIHYDVGGYSSTINVQPLVDFNMKLIASPKLIEAQTDFLTKNQRKSTSLISNNAQSNYQQLFNQYLKDKNIIMDNIMELSSIEAIKKCVISNMGVAYLPDFTVENELEKGELKSIPTDLDNHKITAIYTYHKNKFITPAMELFISLLKEMI